MTKSCFKACGNAARIVICGAALIALPARAETSAPASYVTPRVVVYPGDVIDAGALVEARDDGRYVSMEIARSRSAVEGRVSRRTLLPGMPIYLNAVMARRLIRNGAEVRLTYAEGDLTIVASGEAMQDGGVGDVIKCRNPSSGAIISGIVQLDGTIRVGG